MKSKTVKKYITYTLLSISMIGLLSTTAKADSDNGWVNTSSGWEYIANETKSTGWLTWNGHWYLLDNNGIMKTGWTEDNGKYYYLDSNGKMLSHATTPDGYFVDEHGVWNGKAVTLDVEKLYSSTVGNSVQAIIVKTASYGQVGASIDTFEKDNGVWKEVYSDIPASIGRNGFASIGGKYEGDGKSPSGKFTITQAFGKYANPGTKLRYTQVNSSDYWIDDANLETYNTFEEGLQFKGHGENLLRSDNLYNYAMVIDYNTNCVRGLGSAIFFHVWRGYGQGTAGCTSVSQDNLLKIMNWIDPSKNPIIIEGTSDILNNM